MKPSKHAPTKPTLIHQIDAVRRQHRVVIFRDSRPDEGPWFELSAIAWHKGYLASVTEGNGLPEGIFTISRRQYEVLS